MPPTDERIDPSTSMQQFNQHLPSYSVRWMSSTTSVGIVSGQSNVGVVPDTQGARAVTRHLLARIVSPSGSVRTLSGHFSTEHYPRQLHTRNYPDTNTTVTIPTAPIHGTIIVSGDSPGRTLADTSKTYMYRYDTVNSSFCRLTCTLVSGSQQWTQTTVISHES